MQGPCSVDGNIGMPLQLSGEIQNADKEKLSTMLPNDFSFSFASFRTKPSMDYENGNIVLPGTGTNTVNFQGATYTLVSLRVTRPQHLNFSDNQGSTFLELICTFQNTRPSKEAPFLFMLCFPIYNEPSGTKNTFLNSVFSMSPMTGTSSIQELVTDAKDFMFYTSCIPMIGKAKPEIRSLSCCVLVGRRALPLMKHGDWPHRFYLMPSVYLLDYDTIVEFKLENFQFAPSSIKRGPNGRTYSATVLTSGDQFTKRFALYTYDKALLDQATAKQCQSRQLSTSQLKCFPIKAKQDIKSGILLVDPKTGKRMDVFLQEQDAANYPKPSQDTTGDKLATILGITIGVLAAVVIAGFVAVYFYQFNKKPPAGAFKAHVKVGQGAGAGAFKAHVKVNGPSATTSVDSADKLPADEVKPEASTVAKAEPQTATQGTPQKPETATVTGTQAAKGQVGISGAIPDASKATVSSATKQPEQAQEITQPQGQEVQPVELTNKNIIREDVAKPVAVIQGEGKAPSRSASPLLTQQAVRSEITEVKAAIPEPQKASMTSAAKAPEEIKPVATTAEQQKVELINTSTIRGPSLPNNVTLRAKPARRRMSFDQPTGLTKPMTKE
jgi:hypothetical protein